MLNDLGSLRDQELGLPYFTYSEYGTGRVLHRQEALAAANLCRAALCVWCLVRAVWDLCVMEPRGPGHWGHSVAATMCRSPRVQGAGDTAWPPPCDGAPGSRVLGTQHGRQHVSSNTGTQSRSYKLGFACGDWRRRVSGGKWGHRLSSGRWPALSMA